ncbi:MAG: tyrosine-type recombinase/integrase, partial [Nitrososphaera sp.]
MVPQGDMKEKAYSDFYRTIKSEATRESYDLSLKQFKQWMKAETYAALLKFEAKEIQDKIVEYIDSLKERGIANASIKTKLAGLRHFYIINDMPTVNFDKIYKFIGPQKRVVVDRLPTREEIQKVLNAADIRKQAAFFLLLAGLRVGALPGLKVGDLKKYEEHGVYGLKVYRGEPDEYLTFLTKEGTAAIDAYLEYRRQYGETITDKSPLIRDQFNIRDKKAAAKVRALTKGAFEDMLFKVQMDAGVVKRGHDQYARRDVMPNHGYRKFFNSMLQEAGVKPIIKEKLMGHSAGLEAAYLRPSEQELLNEFLKAMPLLTISDAEEWKAKAEMLQLTVDEELKNLRAEIAELRATREYKDKV